MRTSTRTLTVVACALVLAGCTSGGDGGGTAAPTDDPTPTTTGPDPAPTTPAPTGGAGAAPADLAPEVLLPATAWDLPVDPREESAGVVDWRLPQACDAGAPESATAMRTVVQGDGQAEAQVGVQQVALFADADAAVAEADRLAAVLRECTTYASDTATTYVVEPVEIGAQGTGIATDYYGASATGSLDEAIGSYLVTTRRGTAITLVGVEGGEALVSSARGTATEQAQSAWALLCGYDSSGC